ncbi:unnamed protein product [Lymnaea stagnalis]|uniref:Retinoblastoma-associated protein n=1 Tax=Lymnaea stagnalis TaxID=6523 RepID=A0AAV2IAQ2_LYMST
MDLILMANQESPLNINMIPGSDMSQSQSNSVRELLYQARLEKYNEFCNFHAITNDVKKRSDHVLQELLRLGVLDDDLKVNENCLFASIIYMAVIEARLPYGPMDPLLEQNSLEPSITVTDILIKANINIKSFFQAMTRIKNLISLSKSVQDHLVKLERNYLVVSALYHAFDGRLCSSVFKESTSGCSEDSYLPPIPETEGLSYRKKQCWVLYLLSKEQLLPGNQELFQHFQLLLCCVEFVLRQTPSFLLNSPYDSIRIGCYNTHEQGVTMLGRLAEDFSVAVDQTLQLHIESTESFFQSLLNEDGELDSDGLCEEYESAFQREGDINELHFLSKDSYLHSLAVKRIESQENATPLPSELMTPVRLAVSTVQSFQKNFSGLPSKPSEKLESYFKRCTQDPSGNIKTLIDSLKEIFVQQYQAASPAATPPTTVAENRFVLGVRMYLKILETILMTESEHLSPHVLSTLLNKESFHKALLACALEVVLTTYGQTWAQPTDGSNSQETIFSFPWILDVFSLQVYEFYKVIESFIKAEPKLATDIVKHLQNVEIRILESLAWKENSMLFDVIGDWDMGQMTPPIPASPVKAQDGSPHSTNGPSKCAVDLFLSPVKQQSPSPSSSPSRHQAATSSEPLINDASPGRLPSQPKSQSLTHFLKRVLRLGYSRLTRLCSDLHISKDLEHKIWTCFEYCVTNLSRLLKNRHIDQIIMCSIYGICKVAEQEIRFKSIVQEYKHLPHAKQEIFRDVYMGPNRSDSIISFYNSIFVQNIKMYLLQFSPNKDVRPTLSPRPKQSPGYCLPGKKNFIISPLKESVFKAPCSPSQMTPSTRLLYSFGDSIGSSEKLKDINERMRRGPAASAKKRLNLDDNAETPSAKKSLLQ